MNVDEEAVAWLRAQIENDLKWWTERSSSLRYYACVEQRGTARELDDAADRVADCEAKLALIGEHGGEHMCFSNSHDGGTWDYWIGDCRVMITLATAYRHRPGYARHWPGTVSS